MKNTLWLSVALIASIAYPSEVVLLTSKDRIDSVLSRSHATHKHYAEMKRKMDRQPQAKPVDTTVTEAEEETVTVEAVGMGAATVPTVVGSAGSGTGSGYGRGAGGMTSDGASRGRATTVPVAEFNALSAKVENLEKGLLEILENHQNSLEQNKFILQLNQQKFDFWTNLAATLAGIVGTICTALGGFFAYKKFLGGKPATP